MQKAYIEPAKCIRCPKCYAAKACPINAVFRISEDDPNIVDMAKCHGCGDCVSKCPAQAVILKNG